MTKVELRKIYLDKRGSLTTLDTLKLNEKLAWQFFETIDLTSVKNFHTFIRIVKFNEADTSMIYSPMRSLVPNIRTFAPRVDLASGNMENVAFDAETEWKVNDWGISEPASGEIIDPTEIDIALVPLLAFDNKGHRVGYGKGFYDRFLAQCRPDCLKIGLSFFPPVERIDDVSEHDVRLDKCITPDAVYDF